MRTTWWASTQIEMELHAECVHAAHCAASHPGIQRFLRTWRVCAYARPSCPKGHRLLYAREGEGLSGACNHKPVVSGRGRRCAHHGAACLGPGACAFTLTMRLSL